MKTKAKLLLCSLALSCSVLSQTSTTVRTSDSVYVAYEAKMEEMFDSVDLSYVPNGMLFDYGFPYIEMEPFRGVISDSSKASPLTFGLLYASLTSMAVDSLSVLPVSDDYMTVMDTITTQSNVIPIVGLHQEYYKLDTLAVEDSLMSLSGDNLSDIFPRPRSPYLKHEVFTFCPATLYTRETSINFFFDSNLFYNNTGKTVDSLFMDFGNGQGYLEVDMDQNIPIVFQESGNHNFKVKLVYTDGTIYYSHFDLGVRSSALLAADDPDIVYNVSESSENVGGSVNVYLACGHEQIEKPFIWAEAFNPAIGAVDANLDVNKILLRLDHEDGEYAEKSLLEYLEENNYDLIILDYNDGAAALPRTAEFIKSAVNWVNDKKHAAGSNAKNVLLGQSMGGVAATEALREMENDPMADHECETFIVFDSPLNGANIPMAAQASLLDMATLWVNRPFGADGYLCNYVSPFRDLLRVLYTPATRTMIAEQCDDVNVGGGSYSARDETSTIVDRSPDILYTDYYNDLHAPGAGMPQECEVIVIANGSNRGTGGKQPFTPGVGILSVNVNNMVIGAIASELLQDLDEDGPGLGTGESAIVGGVAGLVSWLVGDGVLVFTHFYAMKNATDFKYYSNLIYLNPWWTFDPILCHDNEVTRTGGLEVDHTPGGFFGDRNQGIFLTDAIGEAVNDFKMHTYCFTPTGSVLNYKDGTDNWADDMLRAYDDPAADLTAGKMPGIDSYLANPLEVPFDDDPDDETYFNTAHTWFTPKQTEYLLYHLVGSNELDGVTSIGPTKTFNFGKTGLTPSTDYASSLPIRTTSIIEEDLTINSSSITVNADAPIGMTPSPYAPDVLGDTEENSHFVVSLGPLCDSDPVTLSLKFVSTMTIGDGDTRTGSVLVGDGHEIRVEAGSTVRVKSGSTLKLTNGSKLTLLENANLIIEDGGSVITEEGSVIHYHEDAEVELNGSEALLQLGGKLHLHEDAVFKPTHDGVSSGMISIANPEGTLIAEAGSEFRIIGDNELDPYLTFLWNGKLTLAGTLDQCFIGSCKVLFRSEHVEPIRSFTSFIASNVTFEAQDNLETLNQHPIIGFYAKAYISLCEFNDVILYGDQMLPDDGVFLVALNSDFEYTYKPSDYFIEISSGNVAINNCDFLNYASHSLFLNGLTSYSYIQNSDFVGQSSEPACGVFAVTDNEFMVKNSTFTTGDAGIWQNQGQLSLRCNEFDDMSVFGVLVTTNGALEMSDNHKMGYNVFEDISGENVSLLNADYLGFSGGYNDFWDNGGGVPIIGGSVSFSQPAALTYPALRNKWNLAGTIPPSNDIDIITHGTTDAVDYTIGSIQTGTCGQYDPSSPPYTPYDENAAPSLPDITLGGGGGEPPAVTLRLDSAVSHAVANTNLWDSNKSDVAALGLFEDILTSQLTAAELAMPETQRYLDLAYNAMKYTVGHAVADSVILRANNATSFEPAVQKYVDVLNDLTVADTFGVDDYKKRFSLEMDKANLFRMLGHTNTGLQILQNMSFCDLDSMERVALNQMMFIYEEEDTRQTIGVSAYRSDTVFTDTSNYTTPFTTQATEFYFGSVINSVSSVTYRICTGSKAPLEEERMENGLVFSLYPNPSNGQFNIQYELPEHSSSQVVVFTPDGKMVYRQNLKAGPQKEVIDISYLQSGVYIYTVIVDEEIQKTDRISIMN